ncbi:MAG: hypothetical protein ABH827_01475 [bacterium]
MIPTVRFFLILLIVFVFVPVQSSYGAKKLTINAGIKRDDLNQNLERIIEQDGVIQRDLVLNTGKSWPLGGSRLLSPKEKRKDLGLFCLNEIVTVISLLKYGFKIIGDDRYIHEFEQVKNEFFWSLPKSDNLNFKDIGSCFLGAGYELMMIVGELIGKFKLSENLFFHKDKEKKRDQDFYCWFSGFTPFIICFLDYCLKKESGNLFAASPEVFDEKSSYYIDIEHVLELLNNRLRVYDEYLDYLGDPFFVNDKTKKCPLDLCRLMVRRKGREVVGQIKERHKKMWENCKFEEYE